MIFNFLLRLTVVATIKRSSHTFSQIFFSFKCSNWFILRHVEFIFQQLLLACPNFNNLKSRPGVFSRDDLTQTSLNVRSRMGPRLSAGALLWSRRGGTFPSRSDWKRECGSGQLSLSPLWSDNPLFCRPRTGERERERASYVQKYLPSASQRSLLIASD